MQTDCCDFVCRSCGRANAIAIAIATAADVGTIVVACTRLPFNRLIYNRNLTCFSLSPFSPFSL